MTPTHPMFAPEPALAERLARTTALVARVLDAGAPEPLTVSVSFQADQPIVVSAPWLPGAPLRALLAWAGQMTGATLTAVVHQPFPGATESLVSVYANGEIDGLAVEVVGSAGYRELPDLDYRPARYGKRQPLDAAAVEALAATEEPIDLPAVP